MSEHTIIQLIQYNTGPTAGTLDVKVQEPGKGEISFDPAQMPDEFKALRTEVQVSALKTAAEATIRADEAEAKFAAVAGEDIEALKAENAAKDANMQTLMSEVEALKAGV